MTYSYYLLAHDTTDIWIWWYTRRKILKIRLGLEENWSEKIYMTEMIFQRPFIFIVIPKHPHVIQYPKTILLYKHTIQITTWGGKLEGGVWLCVKNGRLGVGGGGDKGYLSSAFSFTVWHEFFIRLILVFIPRIFCCFLVTDLQTNSYNFQSIIFCNNWEWTRLINYLELMQHWSNLMKISFLYWAILFKNFFTPNIFKNLLLSIWVIILLTKWTSQSINYLLMPVIHILDILFPLHFRTMIWVNCVKLVCI